MGALRIWDMDSSVFSKKKLVWYSCNVTDVYLTTVLVANIIVCQIVYCAYKK